MKRKKRASYNQRGAALITTLLIVSIVTIIATSMLSRKNLEIRRQANLIYLAQAYQYAIGAENLAKQILLKDEYKNDNLQDFWAEEQEYQLEGAYMQLSIEDLQGRFNLNNLEWDEDKDKAKNAASYQQFKNLVEAGGGGSILAYLVAQHNFISPTELMLIDGMEYSTYTKLLPLVTVLPKSEIAINVNTASAAILKSLNYSIDQGSLNDIEKKQIAGGYDNLIKFASWIRLDSLDSKVPTLSLNSSYFLIKTTITIDHLSFKMFSKVYRTKDKVYLLQRSLSEL